MKMGNVFKTTVLGSSLLLASTMAGAQNSAAIDWDSLELEQQRMENETKGVLGGALIGAVLGGPPGAILTAAAGALISQHNTAERANNQLQSALDQSRQELMALREAKRELEAQYALAMENRQNAQIVRTSFQAEASPDSPMACYQDSALTLHFRTGSSTLENHYRTALARLGGLAEANPEMAIQITGYADSRGAYDDNLQLSRERVEAVETTLRDLGVSNATIHSVAYGESNPLVDDDTREGLFYDRRVYVELRPKGSSYLTRSGD